MARGRKLMDLLGYQISHPFSARIAFILAVVIIHKPCFAIKGWSRRLFSLSELSLSELLTYFASRIRC
jgi:hypothetical protein